MRYARTVALVAGGLCLSLAVLLQGILPAMLPESRRTDVTRVVRTRLGELKWTLAEARDYTPLERRGRRVYIREGCGYCHSQYVRPVAGEDRRWGPVSEAGEAAFDLPQLLSTRRIGPDLSRIGLKVSDGWHVAHLWDPRALVPDSIMPRFPWLYEGPRGPVAVVAAPDRSGATPWTLARTATTEAIFDFDRGNPLPLTPNARGLVYVPERGRAPVILLPHGREPPPTVRLLLPTPDLLALIAYLQKLGTNRGKWRDVFEPQRFEAPDLRLPLTAARLARGREVYTRRCEGCHGTSGDGNGPAATFLRVRPRDFRLGLFKFRHTPSGSLPTDGDLMQVVIRGVPGTAMPSWHMLPAVDREAVIQHVKYALAIDPGDPEDPDDDYAFFREETPEPPIPIGPAPLASPALVTLGRAVWEELQCGECHGREGRGDGPSAEGLTDAWGFPIRPADLTTGRFRSGPSLRDLYRTMTTGLAGTPMPSYDETVPDPADRWAVAAYVLSLSAYKDPLTGRGLDLSPATRDALDDPARRAGAPAEAYRPPPGPTKDPPSPRRQALAPSPTGNAEGR